MGASLSFQNKTVRPPQAVFGVSRRDEFLTDSTTKAAPGDRLKDRRVVDLLGAVRFVASGITGDVNVTERAVMLFYRTDQIPPP